jgi:amidase
MGKPLKLVAPLANLLATLTIVAPASAESPQWIAELKASLSDGSTSCHAVVAAALSRIEMSERPGGINAVTETNPAALQIADRRDAQQAGGQRLGPLHCVPVLIKDNYQTADRLATTAGSVTMRGYHAPRDAFVVSRLREAGAVVVGKANMDEWAHGISGYSSLGGQTRNGLNGKRGPGGSSGGSAAAVAAGLVPLATGSDSGGSIQIPASYNGVVGLRSTIGLISRAGILPYTETADVAGPLVGSVGDLALVLGTMTGVDPADPATRASRGHFLTDYTPFLDPNGLQGQRIGVLERAFGASFESKSRAVDSGFDQALATLRASGATVLEDLPPLRSREAGWKKFITVVGPEFPSEIDAWFKRAGKDAPVDSLAEVIAESSRPRLRRRVRVLDTLKSEQALPPPRGRRYRRAERDLLDLRRATNAYLRDHDLDAVIYPASGCPAPPRAGVMDTTYRCGRATAPLPFGANPGTIAPLLSPATGLPVLSLPGAPLPGGMRTGLSLLGPPWSEPDLIRMGYAFELSAASD